MIHAKYFRSRLAELNYDHDLDRWITETNIQK
jgi:hypothetical protein